MVAVGREIYEKIWHASLGYMTFHLVLETVAYVGFVNDLEPSYIVVHAYNIDLNRFPCLRAAWFHRSMTRYVFFEVKVHSSISNQNSYSPSLFGDSLTHLRGLESQN